jgi:hypothetical protein
MWDSFLILLGLHPILATLLPATMGCLLTLIKGKRLLRMFGYLCLFLGISLGGTLHFRWDSFSIHFSGTPKTSNVRELKVLFVGDSITSEGTRPRGFITKIESFLPIEHQVVCQKGATSIEIVDLLEQTSVELDPVFIIAQSGINDFLNGSTQDKVFRSQEILLEKLVTKFPRSEVYFLPIHPLKLPNRSISEFPSLTPANFPAWWEDPTYFVQNSLLADGVHLSANGHSHLAKAIVHHLLTRNS